LPQSGQLASAHDRPSPAYCNQSQFTRPVSLTYTLRSKPQTPDLENSSKGKLAGEW
jgi:hypothetical protein